MLLIIHLLDNNELTVISSGIDIKTTVNEENVLLEVGNSKYDKNKF